jgi:hypothetical protein
MTTTTTTVMIPVSIGELIDKITILELKQQYITDQVKLKNVQHELDELNMILKNLDIQLPLTEQREALKTVNRELWHIENFKRGCEREQLFDHKFIQAARDVYLKNDLRAQIKRDINTVTGSSIVEEKSY